MVAPVVSSFPPIENPNAAILILGSMPGNASLTAAQYYAHPRNAFWSIMSKVLRFDLNLPYDKRIEKVKAARIAVWDVLEQCVRAGSLDSAIKKESCVANDFVAFFNHHPHIQLIAFNGAEAEKLFKRYVMPDIRLTKTKLISLPSTSPAYTIPLEQKAAAWLTALSV